MVIANSSQRGSSRRRLAPDPMRRWAAPEPHDLLLGMAPAHLPENAPAWVCAALEAGWPVVVRRAPADPARVAIGVRGLAREQRWAGWMPLAAITRRLRPEALGQREPAMLRDLPAWRALRDLRAPLNALGLAWGVTGGAGFELASGVAVLHPDSDLDLLLRTRARSRAMTRYACCNASSSVPAGSTCNCRPRRAAWPCANGPRVGPGCWRKAARRRCCWKTPGGSRRSRHERAVRLSRPGRPTSRHARGLARRTAGARLPGAGGGLSRPGAGRTGERRGLARHPRGAVVPADRRGRRQPPAGDARASAGAGRRAVHRRLSGGGGGRRWTSTTRCVWWRCAAN